MTCGRFEFLIEWGLFLCALLSIGTTIGIIAVLTVETVGFLREVPIAEFLFGTEWTPLFADAALRRPAARRRHDCSSRSSRCWWRCRWDC